MPVCLHIIHKELHEIINQRRDEKYKVRGEEYKVVKQMGPSLSLGLNYNYEDS